MTQHLLSLLRTFSNRKVHKIDSDGLEFFQSFFNKIAKNLSGMTLFLPHPFRCMSAFSMFFVPLLKVLGLVPVCLTGFPRCRRFRAKVPGQSWLQGCKVWVMVPGSFSSCCTGFSTNTTRAQRLINYLVFEFYQSRIMNHG